MATGRYEVVAYGDEIHIYDEGDERAAFKYGSVAGEPGAVWYTVHPDLCTLLEPGIDRTHWVITDERDSA